LEKDTATKIVESATELFADKGYHAVSVRDVAKAADVNVSAISYHFNGKDALYLQVFEAQLEPIITLLDEVESLELNADEQLWHYAKGTLEFELKSPHLMRFWHSEHINPTEIGKGILQKFGKRYNSFYSAIIEKGMREGIFDESLNVAHAALAVSGALSAYCMRKPVFKEFMPELLDTHEAFIKQTYDMVIQALKSKKEV